MTGSREAEWQEIRSCTAGYAAALALTGAAFAAVRWQSFGTATTLAIVFGVALIQAIVHFRFFLHVDLKRSSRDNLLLIAFSTLIIVMMVSGSLIILMNLRHRMM